MLHTSSNARITELCKVHTLATNVMNDQLKKAHALNDKYERQLKAKGDQLAVIQVEVSKLKADLKAELESNVQA